MGNHPIALGNQLPQLLVIIGESGKRPFDHAADCVVTMADRSVGTIVNDVIFGVEFWNRLEPALIPNPLSYLPYERFV